MKLTKHIYTIDEIMDKVNPILTRYDIQKVYVFGSYARGEATYSSDIDFYLEKYQYHKRLNIANLFADFEECFLKHVDIITDKDIEHNDCYYVRELYKNIVSEGVLVYEKKQQSSAVQNIELL